jgi:signal transduction histidine kinase
MPLWSGIPGGIPVRHIDARIQDSVPPTADARRLTPWSGYSVSDLRTGSPAIVDEWLALLQGSDPDQERPPELTGALTEVLTHLGDWLSSGSEELPDELRALFRDLGFIYRSHGFTLDRKLRDMEHLEDLLVGEEEPGADRGPTASRHLRRAMRALWAELIQLHDALSQRRERERADALDTFEEILSHELGNRLGAARTGVDILQDASEELSRERRQNLLELIGDGIDAALGTVDDVAAFIQSQKWGEDHAQPLHEVVRGVLKGVRPSARSEGVRLDVDTDEVPDTPVDAGRLRLILSNFFVNAVRYADEEKADPFIRFTARHRDGRLRIEVSDNGIGIPEEEREQVFQLHRRGRNHHDHQGSGLGLTIAAEAVAQLGGEIELESEVGAGTTFRIDLPVAAEDS